MTLANLQLQELLWRFPPFLWRITLGVLVPECRLYYHWRIRPRFLCPNFYCPMIIKSIFWHQNPKTSRVILYRKGGNHHTPRNKPNNAGHPRPSHFSPTVTCNRTGSFSQTQWAAVRIHWESRITAPHLYRSSCCSKACRGDAQKHWLRQHQTNRDQDKWILMKYALLRFFSGSYEEHVKSMEPYHWTKSYLNH